jgi:hypothetical protein
MKIFFLIVFIIELILCDNVAVNNNSNIDSNSTSYTHDSNDSTLPTCSKDNIGYSISKCENEKRNGKNK